MQLRGFLVQLLHFFFCINVLPLRLPTIADTRLLRQPSVSKDHIAFVFGGDIWISDRDGGRPVRITAHPAVGVCAAFFA